jgi:hypothetical protein
VNGEEWSVTAGTTCRTLPGFAAEEQICIVLQDQDPNQMVCELRYRGVEMDVTLNFLNDFALEVALKNGARAADNFGICGGGGPLTPGTRQGTCFRPTRSFLGERAIENALFVTGRGMTPNGNGNFGCRNCEVGTGLWAATCTCEEFESGYDRREYSEYPCEYTELGACYAA